MEQRLGHKREGGGEDATHECVGCNCRRGIFRVSIKEIVYARLCLNAISEVSIQGYEEGAVPGK